MRLAVILVLLSVPILEIGVMVKVGQWLGLWLTLGVVLATAILGTSVIANQGFNAPFRMQEAIRRGETPITTMFDGGLRWLAGFLLLTPGFIADAVGLLLLISPLRRRFAGWITRRFTSFADVEVDVRTSRTTTGRQSWPGASPSSPRGETDANSRDGRRDDGDGPVIEGEFRRVEEHTVNSGRNRPSNTSGT